MWKNSSEWLWGSVCRLSSGWFTANLPFGVCGETPHCCWLSQFLYLRGEEGGGVKSQAIRPFAKRFCLFYCRGSLETTHGLDQGDLDTWRRLFSRLSAHCCLQIDNMALCLSVKHSMRFFMLLWVLQFNQTLWNWTLTQFGDNTIVFFCHFVTSRWHCPF